jgi:hypothetical protein
MPSIGRPPASRSHQLVDAARASRSGISPPRAADGLRRLRHTLPEVNRLVKQFGEMQKLMKQLRWGGRRAAMGQPRTPLGSPMTDHTHPSTSRPRRPLAAHPGAGCAAERRAPRRAGVASAPPPATSLWPAVAPPRGGTTAAARRAPRGSSRARHASSRGPPRARPCSFGTPQPGRRPGHRPTALYTELRLTPGDQGRSFGLSEGLWPSTIPHSVKVARPRPAGRLARMASSVRRIERGSPGSGERGPIPTSSVGEARGLVP